MTKNRSNKTRHKMLKRQGVRKTAKPTIGVKNDTEKTRFDLLSPDFLFEMADIMTFGAKKYADRNYLLGISWSRYFSALMRHAWNWFRGNEVDEETGRSHLAHAGCCLMILYDMQRSGRLGKWDDRPIDRTAPKRLTIIQKIIAFLKPRDYNNEQIG